MLIHLYTSLIGSDTGAPWRKGSASPKRSGESPGSGLPLPDAGFAPVLEVALSFRFSAEKPGMMFKLGAPVFGANLDHFVA